MDKIKSMTENKLGGGSSAPGNGIERKADSMASKQVDMAAGSHGVSKEHQNTLHNGINKKINEKIPGGN